MQTEKVTKQVPEPGRQGPGHVSAADHAGSILFARGCLIIRIPYRSDRKVNSATGQRRRRGSHRTLVGRDKTRIKTINQGVGKKGNTKYINTMLNVWGSMILATV
jgi:hypothetical protein